MWEPGKNAGALGARAPNILQDKKECLFIFRKCPLFLKEKNALKISCPQVLDASYVSGLIV